MDKTQQNATGTTGQEPSPQRMVARRLSRVQPEIRQVLVGVIEDLSKLLDAMFADVDDYFFSRAEDAEDANHHGTYFDSMRSTRIHRRSIKTRLFEDIIETASRFWRRTERKARDSGASQEPRSSDGPQLSVVTDDEFELSVAISGMTEKGNVRHGRAFRSLEDTLDSINDKAKASRGRHPLGIETITDAFVTATRELSLELPAMISLLKLFERHVVDHMGRVYGSALSRLADAGVSIAENPETPPADDRPLAGGSQGAYNGTVDFSELQRYLKGNPHYDGNQTGGRVGANVEQLLDTVSSVQHQYLERLPVFESAGRRPPSLQAFLLNSPMAEGGFRDAGQDQRDMLKLVSDLFEYIFHNENLSVASKALIARMQIPVLKLALVDESLFSDADHPTRRLVNRLAVDGIGWPASEALLKRNALYLAAERMVAQLNECAKPSAELFAELLDEWSDLVAGHRRRAETTVRRLNESVRGKAKLEAAKRIVQTTVNETACDVQLPRVVTEFITDYWTPAMVVACVKHGTGGEPWRRLCGTLEELLAAFNPASESLELDVGELVSELRECLQDYGTDRSVAAEALDPIAEALNRVSDPALVGYEVEDLEVLEEITLTDVADPDAETEPSSDDYRLIHFEPGSWAEFDEPAGPRRSKLAMIDENQLYIFTDDAGRKVREMSRAKVLQGLAAGIIRIVREELLVEKAIDELIANLKTFSPGKRSG